MNSHSIENLCSIKALLLFSHSTLTDFILLAVVKHQLDCENKTQIDDVILLNELASTFH